MCSAGFSNVTTRRPSSVPLKSETSWRGRSRRPGTWCMASVYWNRVRKASFWGCARLSTMSTVAPRTSPCGSPGRTRSPWRATRSPRISTGSPRRPSECHTTRSVTEIAVRLVEDDGHIMLSITDNGNGKADDGGRGMGFDHAVSRPHGWRLAVDRVRSGLRHARDV